MFVLKLEDVIDNRQFSSGIMCVFGILAALFRHNFIYVVIVFDVALVLFERKANNLPKIYNIYEDFASNYGA